MYLFFCGEDEGIVEWNAVSLADTAFIYGRFFQMFCSDVPLMLF
jgi:hypothetical protein